MSTATITEPLLDLTDADDDDYRYIQAALHEGLWRAEVSSNRVLPPELRLTLTEVQGLLALGWREPTDSPASPVEAWYAPNINWFTDFPSGSSSADVADFLARTLAEVFRVPHPSLLTEAGWELIHAEDTPSLPGFG